MRRGAVRRDTAAQHRTVSAAQATTAVAQCIARAQQWQPCNRHSNTACCCEGGVSPERGLPSITGDADGDAGFYAGFMMLHMLDCSPPYTGFAFALLAANTR